MQLVPALTYVQSGSQLSGVRLSAAVIFIKTIGYFPHCRRTAHPYSKKGPYSRGILACDGSICAHSSSSIYCTSLCLFASFLMHISFCSCKPEICDQAARKTWFDRWQNVVLFFEPLWTNFSWRCGPVKHNTISKQSFNLATLTLRPTNC
jgi:hypothetical protein